MTDVEIVRQGMAEFMATVEAALRPMVDAVLKFARDLDAAIHEEYIAAGAIYGDTPAGQLRWFEERSTIARLRAQADDIEERQAMLADFKRLVAADG